MHVQAGGWEDMVPVLRAALRVQHGYYSRVGAAADDVRLAALVLDRSEGPGGAALPPPPHAHRLVAPPPPPPVCGAPGPRG